MKADQRKQLEQNELSRRLSDFWQGSGDGKKSSTLWVIVGAVVLVAVLIIAWRYFNESSTRSRAGAWRQIEQATVADLEPLIEANRGTAVGIAAKAQLARLVMNDGLSKLSIDTKRNDAVASIERARTLYDELVNEAKAKDDALIVREAMLGAAKAEEALVGIAKADAPSESRGSLDRALQRYEQTVNDFGKTPQGKEAAERAKAIRENKEQIQKFYDDLAKRYVKSEPPPPPPIDPILKEPPPKEPIKPLETPKPSDKPADPTKPLNPPPGEPTKPGDKPADPMKPLAPPAKPVDPPKEPTKPTDKPADAPKAGDKPADPPKPDKK